MSAALTTRRGPARPPGKTILPIVTPEGTALHFVVASAGDRLGAFLLDFLLQTLVIVVLVVLALLGLPAGGRGWVLAFLFLAVFLVQNVYFIAFETRTSGRTPGKKRLGLRVMDAQGGPLTTDAVIVRNLMRNLEIYLPLGALLAPQALWPGMPGWTWILAILWMLLFAGMPLFNRRRLRIGDLVAGTVVVDAPRTVLLPDVGARAAKAEDEGAGRWRFEKEQVEVYGTYELQVLEDLLRRGPRKPDQRRAMEAVTERIRKKIGWTEPIPPREVPSFLAAFYAALRAHLEKDLLFGKRKKDKFSAKEDVE